MEWKLISAPNSPKSKLIHHEDPQSLHIGTLAPHAWFVPFSFQASHCAQEELAAKRHNYKLEKSGYTVVCVDGKMAGVGSASCGPALDEKYRIALQKIHLDLMISVAENGARDIFYCGA